ncbi:MAG: hypothetical protein AAF415_14110 [Pseudomonadota bacterium]
MGSSSYVLRQIGRLSALCLLIGSIMIISVVDLFGFSSSTQAISQEITQRVIAPWYDWRVQREDTPEHPATVVLMRPDTFDNWPPSYDEQLDVLKPIIARCPRVISIDLLYQYRRGQDLTIDDFLLNVAEALAVAQADMRCLRPIPIVFGDTNASRPGSGLLESIGQFANDPQGAARHFCEQLKKLPPSFLDLLARQNQPQPAASDAFAAPEEAGEAPWPYCERLDREADDEQAIPLQIALGVIQWNPVESDTNSRYYGADYTRFYRLIAPTREDGRGSLSPAQPCEGIGHPATGKQIDAACWDLAGRPTLAFQTFLAWCSSGGTCPDAKLKRESDLRFGKNATLERRNELLEGEAFTPYLAPIEVQWPVWGPRNNLFLWQGFDLPRDRHFLASMLGRGRCGFEKPPEGIESLGVSALESMRLIASSLPGSAPAARDEATTPCFPLTAVNAQTQIAGILCEDCRPEPHPSESDLVRGSDAWNAIIWNIEKWQDLADDDTGVPSLLRNKAVFVGVLDLAGADVIHTPVHDALPGVFRHAMVFENLTRWGSTIFRMPESRSYMVLGFPVGWSLLLETAISMLLLLMVLVLRHRGFHRRAWEKLEADVALHVALSRWQMTRKILRAFSLQTLGILYIVLIVLVVSIGVTIVKFSLLNHTSFNWLGVSTLSIVPTLLFPRVQQALGFTSGVSIRRPIPAQLPAPTTSGSEDHRF